MLSDTQKIDDEFCDYVMKSHEIMLNFHTAEFTQNFVSEIKNI